MLRLTTPLKVTSADNDVRGERRRGLEAAASIATTLMEAAASIAMLACAEVPRLTGIMANTLMLRRSQPNHRHSLCQHSDGSRDGHVMAGKTVKAGRATTAMVIRRSLTQVHFMMMSAIIFETTRLLLMSH